MENLRITIREVAEDVGISVGSCHVIVSNVLGIKRVVAKLVPKLLNFVQKNLLKLFLRMTLPLKLSISIRNVELCNFLFVGVIIYDTLLSAGCVNCSASYYY